jgi:DNA-binding NarL/FixJ family response regulator
MDLIVHGIRVSPLPALEAPAPMRIATPSRDHNTVRVALVDDHAVIRQALRMVLEHQPDIEVVADLENGRDAVGAVARLRPDVVVMDLVMPGLNGFDATRQVRKASPLTKVVMLSGFVDEDQLLEALRAGASGYLVKKSDLNELIDAIRAVTQGKTYFSEAIREGFNLAEMEDAARRGDGRSIADILTQREREVLQLTAEGHTNQEIADTLSISVKTVEAHKAHIMNKLHVKNRTELIKYALRKNIVKLGTMDEAERALAALGDDE